MKDTARFRVMAGALAFLLVASAVYYLWSSGDAKRFSLQSLSRLEKILAGRNEPIPRDLLILPESAKTKSPAEADQWLRDVLRDEISEAGIRELERSGRFGPLAEIFPETASTWAAAAGAAPAACYAFRMERSGVTAEVVLVPGPDGFRISRCNNVKQMAELP